MKKIIEIYDFFLKIFSSLPERYKEKDFRVQVFFISFFLFVISFSFLSSSNPYRFLLPYKLYSVFFIKKNKIVYYTYDRETKQLLELNKEIFFSEDLEQNILRITQIIEQPEPYLRDFQKKIKETIYFPKYSLGFTKIWKENSVLYIYFNESVVKNFAYSRETKIQDFDFLKNFQIAFVKTIFKNFSDIQEIHWIDSQQKEFVITRN